MFHTSPSAAATPAAAEAAAKAKRQQPKQQHLRLLRQRHKYCRTRYLNHNAEVPTSNLNVIDVRNATRAILQYELTAKKIGNPTTYANHHKLNVLVSLMGTILDFTPAKYKKNVYLRSALSNARQSTANPKDGLATYGT
ncbi:hypothetical protein DPMN_164082 [Dreissena polymorpha]|uniref:Uncharacterized protein n=1 Tax=Dreissena polymorpha TaxID=45954 RepID=A0A9D4EUI3_DREPO|nr:hypothetical protein DPMN_164082 [Dreissena polymorpha]